MNPVVQEVLFRNHVARVGFPIDHGAQLALCRDAEAQGVAFFRMLKEHRVLVFRQFHPCFEGDVLRTEAAVQFTDEGVIAIHLNRYGMVGFRSVLNARHFKVVLREVTRSNAFVEGYHRFIFNGQNAVCRLR